jgi:hypothetical protein
LGETIWSLTSPRTKRISGPKNFGSSAKKDFFNTIARTADTTQGSREVRFAQQETFAKQDATARSNAAPPSLSGHGFDFLKSFRATG